MAPMSVRVCRLLFPVACLLLVACSSRTDPDPGLAIIRLHHDDGHVALVHLTLDYGVIIDNHAGTTPTTYYVFDRDQDRRIRTTSRERFLRYLGDIPAGKRVDVIAKCTVPFFVARNGEPAVDLDAVARRQGFTVVRTTDDHPRHREICTCETRGFDIMSFSAESYEFLPRRNRLRPSFPR